MPNYVSNIVKMKEITNLLLFMEKDGVQCFDFNKIIPMPESLNIECDTIIDEAIIFYLTNRCTVPFPCLDKRKMELARKLLRNEFSKDDWRIIDTFKKAMAAAYKNKLKGNEMYRKGQIYISNYNKYGHTTWYSWCCKNWGTKWNAYSTEREDENTISFETAWDNPEPVMLRLSEMYPEVTIEHWWADEYIGNNHGHRVYRGGKIIDGDYCDQFSYEEYEIHVKCWGKNEC